MLCGAKQPLVHFRITQQHTWRNYKHFSTTATVVSRSYRVAGRMQSRYAWWNLRVRQAKPVDCGNLTDGAQVAF